MDPVPFKGTLLARMTNDYIGCHHSWTRKNEG